MRQMRHVKPHSKAVCLLAPPCAHMVTARFGQSDRPRLNRLRIRRRRKKALAPCENTGKFPQKHSAKCVKNARRRTTEKLQVASPAPLLLLATFQGEGCARYARRTQKYSKSVMRLSIQSENRRKITLTRKTIKSAIRPSNIARTTMI